MKARIFCHCITSFFLLVACCTTRQTVQQTMPLECPEITEEDHVIAHKAYYASFNTITLTPNWVAYVLTANHTDGPYSRKGRYFVPDPDCSCQQPDNNDYRESGFARGHLIPAGDVKWDSTAMHESFYFTNCMPQDIQFNNSKWNQLEEKTRRLAHKYDSVYVVCGPIYDQLDTICIGDNQVAVPDKCFKALLIHNGESYSAIGFIMNNGGEDRTVMDCACTIDALESVIKRDLFFNLPDKIEDAVESKVIWTDW